MTLNIKLFIYGKYISREQLKFKLKSKIFHDPGVGLNWQTDARLVRVCVI